MDFTDSTWFDMVREHDLHLSFTFSSYNIIVSNLTHKWEILCPHFVVQTNILCVDWLLSTSPDKDIFVLIIKIDFDGTFLDFEEMMVCALQQNSSTLMEQTKMDHSNTVGIP